jgi:hypothetical protein
VGLSQVYLGRQEDAAALSEANSALGTSQAVGDRMGIALALRQIAAISAAVCNYDDAQRRTWHALTISGNIRARVLEAQLLQDIADFAAAQGLDEEAEAAHLEAERVRDQVPEWALARGSMARG